MGELSSPYDPEELRRMGPARRFSGRRLREIAFPLGGIGTGCISLGGRGDLRDWEIFGRPNKGYRPGFTFAVLRVKTADGRPIIRVLEGPIQPPYRGARGLANDGGRGFPRMQAASFRGEYPFAWVEFADEDLPVEVSLEAFNPFIPLKPDESALPAAVLLYRVRNTGQEAVSALVGLTLCNVVGHPGAGPFPAEERGGNLNRFRSRGGVASILMTNENIAPGSPRHGSLAISACAGEVTWTARLWEEWLRQDTAQEVWERLRATGRFDCIEEHGPTPEGSTAVGALGARARLRPGESCRVPILLTWHFPNFVKYWGPEPGEGRAVAQPLRPAVRGCRRGGGSRAGRAAPAAGREHAVPRRALSQHPPLPRAGCGR